MNDEKASTPLPWREGSFSEYFLSNLSHKATKSTEFFYLNLFFVFSVALCEDNKKVKKYYKEIIYPIPPKH